MAAAGTMAVNIGDAAKRLCQLTIRVEIKGMQVFRIRVWLGTLLLRLGGAVIGVPTSVEVEG